MYLKEKIIYKRWQTKLLIMTRSMVSELGKKIEGELVFFININPIKTFLTYLLIPL